MKNNKTGKKNVLKKILLIFVSLILILLIISGIGIYRVLLGRNVVLHGQTSDFLLIPTKSNFTDVQDLLRKKNILSHPVTFRYVAGWMDYPEKVRPGRYRITTGMSNLALVSLLRSGRQDPVRVVFNNIRSKEELAGKIAKQIEADSLSLIRLMKDPGYLLQYGVTPLQALALFIPNTYEFFWNTSADQFILRMAEEQGKFWKGGRSEKAKQSGLGITGVVILASIVEKETVKDKEKPFIAGVYLNRLKKAWPLQADPTLIFAWNDYSIRRVLNKHKEINSPYNTYMHTGLPPGPICLPSVASIDAVLNHSITDYMYFCAKEDLSGYHNFAVTLEEHNRNAARYQAALKKMNSN